MTLPIQTIVVHNHTKLFSLYNMNNLKQTANCNFQTIYARATVNKLRKEIFIGTKSTDMLYHHQWKAALGTTNVSRIYKLPTQRDVRY